MFRLCPTCKTLIPARDWEAHRTAHHNAEKPRRPSSWNTARRRALARDHYRCRRCGRTQDQLRAVGVQLHVHHIDGDSTNNALANLITLCDPHHPRGGTPRAIP